MVNILIEQKQQLWKLRTATKMGKTKKEWKFNTRKNLAVANFKRCCRCQFHKIYKDFAD